MPNQTVIQTREEELLNTLTHGLGSCLSIIALPVMLVFAAQTHSTKAVVGVSIFGATLILLYTVSTLYHFFDAKSAKAVFQRLDHICIYLLIAGTYTPFTLYVIGSSLGWSLFGLIWGLALIGIVFKAVFGPRYDTASAALYVVMGWLALFALKPLIQNLSYSGLLFLIGGGLAYTLGVPFYLQDSKKKYFHGIWHCFVLVGSTCHFISINCSMLI